MIPCPCLKWAKPQPSRAPDILESKLVGRLYTLTYGGRELCEQVGLEEAARFELVLEGFHDAFPDVMQQFQQSLYFEETRRGFSRWVKESPELKSKDELANLCLADYKLLKAYTDNKDDPEVVENVSRIRKTLKHRTKLIRLPASGLSDAQCPVRCTSSFTTLSQSGYGQRSYEAHPLGGADGALHRLPPRGRGHLLRS